jgi:hypothetical protein
LGTLATKLAKEFGISDVALGKICKKLDVPKPSLGYWSRVQFGYKTRIHCFLHLRKIFYPAFLFLLPKGRILDLYPFEFFTV